MRVPAEGILASAKLAVVGEQPGKVEVREGRPFSGPAGKQLDKILLNAGLVRDELYLTNVIKDLDKPLSYYVKYNQRSGKVSLSKAGQDYVAELRDELSKLNAQVIVAVGNVAMYALTSRWGINNWRGSILESSLVSDKLIIPTIHPATIIPPKCQYLNKHLITFDFKRAGDVAENGYHPIHRNILIRPSFDQSMEYLRKCLNVNRVAYDIECSNQEVSCISFATSATSAISIPFIHENGDYFTPEQECEIWKLITELLENEAISKIGQNLVFDGHFLLRRYGISARNMDDTMIAQHIIMPDFKKGLDFITSIWTQHPYYKADGKEWFKGNSTWENGWHYNATDSIICAEAFPKQEEAMKEEGNWRTYQRQKKVLEPLIYMMERGIKADIPGIIEEEKNMELEIDRLQDELCTAAGEYLNPSSPKALQDYFYGKLGIKPYKKRGSKKVTVNDDAMKKLDITHDRKEAAIIREMRKLNKLRSTYVNPAKFDDDGRIRCQFNPVGTRFSRLASSSNIFGTGMNLQNWPHGIMKYLTADDGYVGYEFDLSQAENRIVAYVGEIDEMMEAFETGKDVHSLTASLMFRVPVEQVIADDKAKKYVVKTYTMRDIGKRCNHALNYGMGPNLLADNIEVKQNQGKHFHSLYHNAYPRVQDGYHTYVKNQLRTSRTLTNLLGRKTKFMDIWGDELLKDANACIPQGTTGDIINEHGMSFTYYNITPAELLCQIHDAILFQIPLSLGWEEHARLLLEIKSSLEVPLHIHDYDFTVPADLTIFKRFKKGKELKAGKISSNPSELASKLSSLWKEVKDAN